VSGGGRARRERGEEYGRPDAMDVRIWEHKRKREMRKNK
jgi:hypothetical protein